VATGEVPSREARWSTHDREGNVRSGSIASVKVRPKRNPNSARYRGTSPLEEESTQVVALAALVEVTDVYGRATRMSESTS